MPYLEARSVRQEAPFFSMEAISNRNRNDNWRIVPFAVRHVAQAVEIHLRAFPKFFLTSLGAPVLKHFYTAFVAQDDAIAFAAEDTLGRTVGVIVGTGKPAGFFRRMILRQGWAFVFSTVGALIRNPKIAGRLLRAFAYRGWEQPAGLSCALLSSIAVAPELQGTGVGRRLVAQWIGAVQERGIEGAYLTTDAHDNESANRFYRRIGWRLDATHVTPEGRLMHRYVIEIAHD